MSILKNIDDQCEFMRKDPEGAGLTRANDMARDATKAIMKGIGSHEWEKYMESYFAKNGTELNRLTGKDGFSGSEWGKQCLAYIAGNGLCTIMTLGRNGTRASMSPQMIEALEKEVVQPAIRAKSKL
jgi:hypothetical protein